MITSRQKQMFIRKEKEAIAGYKKAGLTSLAKGEMEDLNTVRKLKVRRIFR
jgi:hypothetical protein